MPPPTPPIRNGCGHRGAPARSLAAAAQLGHARGKSAAGASDRATGTTGGSHGGSAAAQRARRCVALRRHRRPRRRLLRSPSRPDPRAHRPERRRQDDAVQLPLAPLHAVCRRHPVRGPLDPRPRAAPHRRARHRPHLPEPRPVPAPDGARQRDGRRPPAQPPAISSATRSPRPGPMPTGTIPAPRRRSSPPGSRSFSPTSISSASPTASSRACRSARRSASSSRARSPCAPKLLLLDEPAGGLNHDEVGALGDAHPPDPRRPRRHRAARRASHEPGDVDLRHGRGARTSAARSPRAAGAGAARSRR